MEWAAFLLHRFCLIDFAAIGKDSRRDQCQAGTYRLYLKGEPMKCLLMYWSKYGQTARIANRIADKLRDSGAQVDIETADSAAKSRQLDDYELVIVGSPIYYGKHSRAVRQFVSENLATLNGKATAFFSVSLSASGNQKQRDDANRCVDKQLQELGWNPKITMILGGGLPFRRYGWITRLLMKWISSKEGGDTDTSRDYDYTDWNSVDAFALELLASANDFKSDLSENSKKDPTIQSFAQETDLESPRRSR